MRIFPGLPAYLALAVFLLVDFIWLVAAGIGINPGSAVPACVALLALGLAAFCLPMLRAGPGQGIDFRGRILVRATFLDRAIVVAEAFFFLVLAWNATRVFNHLSMTTALPYSDALLARWDAALGLDWSAYFAFVASQPELAELLAWSYVILPPASALALFGLLALNRVRTAEFFVAAFFATCAISVVAGMFFPARAAVAYLLEQPDLLLAFSIEPGLYHLSDLEALRAGSTLAFNLNDMPGLVTFPSFHAAAGVVIAWAYRRTFLYWPLFVYALLMIASAPVFGGHYFIDLIAGTAVAVAVLVWAERLPRYRGLFARSVPAATATAPA
jgi:membrane-associated phospholipid phosphatase